MNAFLLSPTYFTNSVFSTALIASDVKKHKQFTYDSMFGIVFLTSSIAMLRLNCLGYRKVLSLMQKHGYRDRLFNIHMKTFCGRQQLKLAAKQMGFVEAQKLHCKKNNVRWYHIDPSPPLTILYSTNEIVKIYISSSCLYKNLQ